MKHIIFALLPLLFLSSCGDTPPAAESSSSSAAAPEAAAPATVSLTEEQMRSAGIETGAPENRVLTSALTANGEVAVLPEGRATVSSKLAGRVERFFIHEGQNVRKGQALMSISSSALFDLQQAYLQAKADLVFLEKEVARQKTLSGEQVGASKMYEEAQSKYLRAQADLQATAAKLKYLGIGVEHLADAAQPNLASTVVVTSPLDGNISSVSVNLGASVTEGTALCHIVNLSDLHAHIEVFTKDIASVQVKSKAVVRFPNTAFPALQTEVEFISRDMSSDSRTYALHIHLPAASGGHQFLPGMPVTAEIQTGAGAMQPALPESAVLHDGNTSYCFVVRGQSGNRMEFERLEFVPTGSSGGWVGVPAEVLQGKLVVLRGAHLVDGEMRKGDMEE